MRSTKGSGKGIRMLRRLVVCLVVAAFAASISVMPALADAGFANSAFERTWQRTDEPVAQLKVSRTWMWGPSPNTGALSEPYVEAPGGQRTVQYFDKSRMEDNSYRASAPWDVTNGLLAEELITGRMQFGDTLFRQFAPAQVNVAGDANDPNGPTYATFNPLMGYGAIPTGWIITQTVNRAGQVGNDPAASQYQVSALDVGAPTHHTVASVFWQFMNASGLVDDNGQYSTEALFLNPFYATGYPLTEAYWTTVLVGGVSKQVLVQVFERRVLTYTPSNPAGWQVEAGNVGQHYYSWRYQQLGNPGPTEPHTLQASATVSSSTPQPNSEVTVTGQLSDNGSGVAGAAMTATWHLAGGDQSCSGTTGADGKASCSLNIGNAPVNQPVTVDVTFSYQGQTFTASTSFTPQAVSQGV